jgi:hypothetical protein
MDLAATMGSDRISVAFQGSEPGRWTTSSVHVGTGGIVLRAADLDGDGDADLAVTDPGTVLYLLFSNGDRTPTW